MFKKYKIWVINWHNHLQLWIPSDYQIFIRYIFNDLYRYIHCKFFLYNRLVDNNDELRNKIKILEKLNKKLNKKLTKKLW